MLLHMVQPLLKPDHALHHRQLLLQHIFHCLLPLLHRQHCLLHPGKVYHHFCHPHTRLHRSTLRGRVAERGQWRRCRYRGGKKLVLYKIGTDKIGTGKNWYIFLKKSGKIWYVFFGKPRRRRRREGKIAFILLKISKNVRKNLVQILKNVRIYLVRFLKTNFFHTIFL